MPKIQTHVNNGVLIKPGILGHRWQLMTIRLDLKIRIGLPMVRLASVSGGIGSVSASKLAKILGNIGCF
jgi:hypothetical protein